MTDLIGVIYWLCIFCSLLKSEFLYTVHMDNVHTMHILHGFSHMLNVVYSYILIRLSYIRSGKSGRLKSVFRERKGRDIDLNREVCYISCKQMVTWN